MVGAWGASMVDCDSRQRRVVQLMERIHPLVREASRPDCPPLRRAELLQRLEPLYRALFSIQEEFE
ncbi:MAG: hypothetical protein VKI81_07000 [Synechococcaceae cyanobacterium]|nr:hypothetical protein [Synechococcaceae cyanobacterium]